jgi:hypothetical protein
MIIRDPKMKPKKKERRKMMSILFFFFADQQGILKAMTKAGRLG